MKRLLRWFFSGVSLLSLLACLGAAWLWGRSYRTPGPAGPDALDLTRREPLYWLVSDPGRLTLCGQQGKEWDSPRRKFNLGGLEFASSRVGGSFLWNLLVPYWMLVPLLAVAPLLWLGTRARRSLGALAVRRRRRLGHCPACGYDLKGNTSGRCSECGESIEAGQADRRVRV
jgi:hypothetical protein